MERLNLIQGSPEWIAHRARHFNASDAPAMLGCSPYKTRAQLLAELHGAVTEVDAATQRRFDEGHRFEALARPLAEEIIGEDLAPVVGTSGELSASFDGLTMMGDVAFEHKTLNDELRTVLPTERGRGAPDSLPKHYRVQMEQQLLVSGAERVLFMATCWTPSGEITEERHCWYTSDPALRAEIVAGWKQFAQDLATYKPAPAAEIVTAAPIEALPAVSVRMDGALAVVSNLDVFGAALRGFIDKIPAKPTSDQEFADCDAACKALKKAEEALDAAEASALGQVQSVEQLTRTIADLRNAARTARLASEKVVAARKTQIRTEEVQRGKDALNAHIAGLNTRLGKPYMPVIAADFAGAISGKKTLDSVRAAIDQHLADKKIEANAVADRIQINLDWLREHAKDHHFLFADAAQLVLKANDDFKAVASARITEHKQAEERRQEQERERIRAEEAARIEREQQATATPPPTSAPAVAPTAPAANAATVVPMPRATAAPATPPTLRLGQINERLAPIQLSVAGLAQLGFTAAGKDKAAVLYHEADFPRICHALVLHVQGVQQQLQAA